mgnify:CR=1 FL=1
MVVCKGGNPKTKKTAKLAEFTKAEFLSAPSYADKRDLVEAVWQGETMTMKDLDNKIKSFLKGCVE